MIEVSFLFFTLLIEGFILMLLLLLVWIILIIRRSKRDRLAAETLVQHIKHQSKTRTEITSSFLNEKYLLEGNDLKQAVLSIDLTERKFYQKLINVYLQRDAQGFTSMDASVAEMVDIYKSLSPVMPESEALDTEKTLKELDEKENKIKELQGSHDKLVEELAITKETMSNMIGEFGNMFGGGQDHDLDKSEVLEKVVEQQDLDEGDPVTEESESTTAISVSAETGEDNDVDIDMDDSKTGSSQSKPTEAGEETEKDVDELLKSLDLSDDKS